MVGLGNRAITPDAVGPRTVEMILVTRHLMEQMPEAVEGLGSVCALEPNVMAMTGMESAEVIRGVAQRVKPSLLVVVDALAARDVGRLGTTFQLCDTGISPGSGVQNRRKELSQATMGIPVIAVGVPTVVDGATLTLDLLDQAGWEEPSRQKLEQALQGLPPLMVTPKEVDSMVTRASRLLAYGINKALHHGISVQEVAQLLS